MVKLSATFNYRLERAAKMLAAACAAALAGWALALLIAQWADGRAQRLPAWTPFALSPLNVTNAPAAAPAANGPARLVGVAGRQAYFSVGGTGATTAQRSIAIAEGEPLPSGERLLRVERDAVVLSAAGHETRVELRPAKTAGPVKGTPPAHCRLAAADKAAAIFLDAAVVKALTAERATFGRMFEPAGAVGGIRARGTGGTTAMFAVQDGDVLLRADGAPLRTGEAIVTEVLSRIEAGGSVLVEGTRGGAPRRWVYAAKGCGG